MPVQRFQTDFALAGPSSSSSSRTPASRRRSAPAPSSSFSFTTALNSVSSRVAKLFKASTSSLGSLSGGSSMSIATPPPSQSPPPNHQQPLPQSRPVPQSQPVASSSSLAPAPRSALRFASSHRPRTRTVTRRHVHYKSEQDSILPPSPRRSRSPVLAEVSLSLWGPPSPPLSPTSSALPKVIHTHPIAGPNTGAPGPSSASASGSNSASRPIKPKPRRPHPTRTRAHLHLDTTIPSSSQLYPSTSAWDGTRLQGLNSSCSRSVMMRRAQAELRASRVTVGLRSLKREDNPVDVVRRGLDVSPRSKGRSQRRSAKVEEEDIPLSVKAASIPSQNTQIPSLSLGSTSSSSAKRKALANTDDNSSDRLDRLKRPRFTSNSSPWSSMSLSMSMTPESLYPTPENSQAHSDNEIEVLLGSSTTVNLAGTKRRRSPSLDDLEGSFDRVSEPAMSTTPSLASLGSMSLASPAPKRQRVAMTPVSNNTPTRSSSARALRRTGTSCSGSVIGLGHAMGTRSRTVGPRVLRLG